MTAARLAAAAALPAAGVAASTPLVAPAPLVELQGLTKVFGAGADALKALDDVSLAIRRNEFFTLLGPSGCGKTTLLRLLAGFEQPTAGALLLDGRDIAGDPPNRRPVNTVFQSYALFPHMSVAENIAFGLKRLGRRAEVAGRVAAMMRLVQLEGLGARRPHQLSGGQQQRVALARALAPGPRLLLLDEPLSALDLKLRRQMQVELKRIQREAGVTFILVTHDQEEALSLSDRVAVMDAGRVLQVGAPAALYARPASRFVAGFLGEANILPGARFGLPHPFAAIRPERVALSTSPAPGALAGIVSEITFLGATTACLVRLDDGTGLLAKGERLPSPLASGERVWCLCPAEALIPLDR